MFDVYQDFLRHLNETEEDKSVMGLCPKARRQPRRVWFASDVAKLKKKNKTKSWFVCLIMVFRSVSQMEGTRFYDVSRGSEWITILNRFSHTLKKTTKKHKQCQRDVEDQNPSGERIRSQERMYGERWMLVLGKASYLKIITVCSIFVPKKSSLSSLSVW